MDMAPKNGKIKPDMKANGKIIDLMDMEFIIFLVGKNILENGKIVVKMDLENTVVLMAKNMQDFLKKIEKMDLEFIILEIIM